MYKPTLLVMYSATSSSFKTKNSIISSYRHITSSSTSDVTRPPAL